MDFQNSTNKFKEYLSQEKYDKCIEIIEEKIITYIVNLIKEKDKEYRYTNIIDLMNDSEFYLKNESKYIAQKIYSFDTEERDINKLERLLEICEIYNIK